MSENLQIRLAARPTGAATKSCVLIEEGKMPSPGEGEILVKHRFLSLDPYMRGRMSDAESYADPVEVGAVMIGGTVGTVLESRHPKLREGDAVMTTGGWQQHSVASGDEARKVQLPDDRLSLALGALGMPGFTAWWGLHRIGRPQAGETLVVAAATGPVGSMVAQLARHAGLRAVGVAGGKTKCAFAVDELGLDACVDHRGEYFADELAGQCPDGIDIYFENVGLPVLRPVMKVLNDHARIWGISRRSSTWSGQSGLDASK